MIEPTDDRAAFGGFEKESKSLASWVGSIVSIIRIASERDDYLALTDKHSAAFRSLTLRFWPRGASGESRPRSRDAFLRELALGISQQPFFWYMHRAEDGLSLELPRHEDDPPDMPDWWRRRILARLPWEKAGFKSPNITIKLHSMPIGTIYRSSHDRTPPVVADRLYLLARIDTYAPKSSPPASNSIWIPVAEEPPSRASSPERLLRPSGLTAQSTS